MPPRQLFFFEAPEDGGGAAPVEPVEPDAGAGASLTSEAPPAAEEPWALTRQDWEATVGYLQQTAPLLQQMAMFMQQGGPQQQQPQAPAYQEPSLPELDPFDPESVQAHIEARVMAGMEEAMGPYRHMFNTMAESEGERLARSTMERLDQEVGHFDHDAAYMIAAGALGDESLNPNDVLTSAARYMHDFEASIRADERQKYQSELAGLRDLPPDGSVGSAAAQETETVPRGPRRYHEAVERALARRNPTMPVG